MNDGDVRDLQSALRRFARELEPTERPRIFLRLGTALEDEGEAIIDRAAFRGSALIHLGRYAKELPATLDKEDAAGAR